MPKKRKSKSQKIKDLHLDKPTSHGGWPGGHSGGWISKKPVNQQIADWLDSMGMLEDSDRARLSENKLRLLIRKLLTSTHNY